MGRKPRERRLLTVEMDEATWDELDALCRLEAEVSGSNPDRLRSPIVRRLIRSESRKIRKTSTKTLDTL